MGITLNQPQVVVVMVPFPAQGHLNQLLQLSLLVTSYNIPVHYVGSTTHNRQAKLRAHGGHPLGIEKIHFHDFPVPPFYSPPPNPDAAIKFPAHLQPMFDASSSLREPVAALLRVLSAKAARVVVVHDSLMASVVQDVALIQNAESYTFHSVSAFAIYLYKYEATGKASNPKIPKDLPSLKDCFTLEFLNFIKSQYELTKLNSGLLYNTCKIIEAPYIDLLEKEMVGSNKKQWAIGPFNPVSVTKNRYSERGHKCLQWLDKQAPNSVLYVSFGTTTALSDEQVKELAYGLEQSKQKFIWVLRDADKGNVFVGEVRRVELPRGYEERVHGMGMVVRDWAPQLEILGHVATGGFMSHCGWNSCMESISMGVPIAAWPMHSDQPRNTVLVTQVLKLGLVVKEWARREEVVTSSAVEKAVRRLMESKEGNGMRKRAADLGGAVQRSMDKGGVSRKELNSFIAHITR